MLCSVQHSAGRKVIKQMDQIFDVMIIGGGAAGMMAAAAAAESGAKVTIYEKNEKVHC